MWNGCFLCVGWFCSIDVYGGVDCYWVYGDNFCVEVVGEFNFDLCFVGGCCIGKELIFVNILLVIVWIGCFIYGLDFVGFWLIDYY